MRNHRHDVRQRTYRALDIALVLAVLPVAVPLAILIAIGIKLDSAGPLIFRARRAGQDGRPFDMLKFRTMRKGVDGPPLRAEGDDRQTPFGRSLSRLRLNELPQLWNVLKGDMAFVGPRPEAPEFVAAYPVAFDEVLRVRPGLTGPAQLAFTDEAEVLAHFAPDLRSGVYVDEILPRKLALDLAYVRRGPRMQDLGMVARSSLMFVGMPPGTKTWKQRTSSALVPVVASSGFTVLFVAEAVTPF